MLPRRTDPLFNALAMLSLAGVVLSLAFLFLSWI
jgi:hypothetical protein